MRATDGAALPRGAGTESGAARPRTDRLKRLRRARIRDPVPRALLTGAAITVEAAFGGVDYVTGPDYGFSLFYLLPVVACGWWLGPGPAAATAVLASVSWFLADYPWHLSGYLSVSLWNTLTRLGIFLAMGLITARVRADKDRLQSLNTELEDFSYTVAHDLRTPLRGMEGLSQALVEDYGGVLDERGREYAREIGASARRMDALTRDLLAYTRVGRGELALEPVDLGSVVREALPQIGDGARQIEVQDGLPAVTAHRGTLVQVVANLLSNAIKFVAPGVAPRVRVFAETRGDRVRLVVADEGIGIAPDHFSRIFGMFERLHVADAYPGTGIGLAIVKKGTERMGGSVGVESAPGRGSAFWIELPRSR